MDRFVYVAMTGARETLRAQAIVNNNLANANTTGFQADLAAMRSQQAFGSGFANRVYAQAERSGVETRPGAIMTTGRALDVAIDGEGYLVVSHPRTNEAYTRDGRLQINANGLLTTENGYPVKGDQGLITIPPHEELLIGPDGTISIRPIGGGGDELEVVDRIRLVKPDVTDLKKNATGMLHQKDPEAPEAVADASVRLAAGAIESSNVNVADALVDMLSYARQFEMQINVMRTAEENERAADQLLRLE